MNPIVNLLTEIHQRNAPLFVFGALNFILAILCLVLARTTHIEVLGVNAWYKPTKFALSIGLFCWTMAWYLHYLGGHPATRYYDWGMVVLLGIEILYIAMQAGRGQLSHFNNSTPFFASMYMVMAVAATLVTLWTAYVGYHFWVGSFPQLSPAYLWGIRLGILLFVVFALEGFVMGARMSSTLGGPSGGQGLPFLNWSRQYGDPRIAHFVGMHALQILPLLSYYLLRSVRATVVVSILYALLAIYVLAQALLGKPLVR